MPLQEMEPTREPACSARLPGQRSVLIGKVSAGTARAVPGGMAPAKASRHATAASRSVHCAGQSMLLRVDDQGGVGGVREGDDAGALAYAQTLGVVPELDKTRVLGITENGHCRRERELA